MNDDDLYSWVAAQAHGWSYEQYMTGIELGVISPSTPPPPEVDTMRCLVCQHPMGDHNDEGCQHDLIGVYIADGMAPADWIRSCHCPAHSSPKRQMSSDELSPHIIELPEID